MRGNELTRVAAEECTVTRVSYRFRLNGTVRIRCASGERAVRKRPFTQIAERWQTRPLRMQQCTTAGHTKAREHAFLYPAERAAVNPQ